MFKNLSVAVVMPALDEEGVIGPTLQTMPEVVDSVWVADNGSSDETAAEARRYGARVVTEKQRGYGAACQAAIRAIGEAGAPDVLVFVDADGSQPLDELDALLSPISNEEADLVIGFRRFADTPFHVALGNQTACTILRWMTGHEFRDLGPFRAIRFTSLQRLRLNDRNWGWNVEMQARALAEGLRIVEVPVSHREREAGRSKISGSIRGTLRAGSKILLTAFLEGLRARRSLRGS